MVTYPAMGASPRHSPKMPPSSIIDVNDPRVREYRLLGDARELQTRGLFVAGWRLVVERMLLDRRYIVDSLLLRPASLKALRAALETRPDVTIFECPTGDFEAITGFNMHPGCLAQVSDCPSCRWRSARWPRPEEVARRHGARAVRYVEREADVLGRTPVRLDVDSLNLAVAIGIGLSQLAGTSAAGERQ